MIEPGETALTVAGRLEEDGFISDAGLFRNYMRYHGIDQRLAAGDFEIAKSMTMPEIAEPLRRARYEEVILRSRRHPRRGSGRSAGCQGSDGWPGLSRAGARRPRRRRGLGRFPWLPRACPRWKAICSLTPTGCQPVRRRSTSSGVLNNSRTPRHGRHASASSESGQDMEQVTNMAASSTRSHAGDDRPLIASVYRDHLTAARRGGGQQLSAGRSPVHDTTSRPGEW